MYIPTADGERKVTTDGLTLVECSGVDDCEEQKRHAGSKRGLV